MPIASMWSVVDIFEQLKQASMARIDHEIIFGKEKLMLPDKDVYIDDMDMNFVQNLITAVNESKLDPVTKFELRKSLDRWQNALTLTDEIRVTF
jgi:hypothetical protein